MRRLIILVVSLLCGTLLQAREFRVFQINIWQEGTKVTGGYEAIVDEIERQDADIVLLCEIRNYGGEDFIQRLLDSLSERGLVYYGRKEGSDANVISRFPLLETAVVGGGSMVKGTFLIDGKKLSVYSAHLDYTHYECWLPRGYSGTTWKKIASPIVDEREILRLNNESKRDEAITAFLEDIKGKEDEWIILGGDFNEPSHLDWTERTKDKAGHNGAVVRWPCSSMLYEAGFRDTYREIYPDPVAFPGYSFPAGNPDADINELTWMPDGDDRDRIDFIYYRPGGGLILSEASIIGPDYSVVEGQRVKEDSRDYYIRPVGIWPTDHKAFRAVFTIPEDKPCNLAVRLDGHQNDLGIGCPVIPPPYTLETWFKPDRGLDNDRSVLLAGLKVESVNYLPLTLEKGVLASPLVGLYANGKVSPEWHHAALVCDGKTTRLYLDGTEVASRDTSVAILPTGINYSYDTGPECAFSGEMDEIRIWRDALPAKTLISWKNRDIEPSHPYFSNLMAYYSFDDGLTELSVNPMGTGHQSYHIRNGLIDPYTGSKSLAYTVSNDNPLFCAYPEGKQLFFNAVVIPSEWDVRSGSGNEALSKLRIRVRGAGKPLNLRSVFLRLKGHETMGAVRIWYAGQTPDCTDRQLLATILNPREKHKVRLPEGGLKLKSGINYLLVTADILNDAETGTEPGADFSWFRLGCRRIRPVSTEETLPKKVLPSAGKGILNVLQWNIWHGGRHLGHHGVDRVIRLIRDSGADIVTMEEGYGNQQIIADSLGMYCQTSSPDANLALLSKYQLEPLKTTRPFFSNPGFVSLPDGSRILVNDLWLRYAYNPAYTENYIDPGMDPAVWIEEDKLRGLSDLQRIVEDDTVPYSDTGTDIIFGGDFNSCSHLDWTDPSLHYGYGPVRFPISDYMYELGFQDSFRVANPDERSRPEGTWAVIYGHLQTCRIDFIYHKGPRLKVLSSKIISSTPEIDDVWPSDHAAVLTVFGY